MNPSWLLGAVGAIACVLPSWLCIAPTQLFPEFSTTQAEQETSPHCPNSLKAHEAYLPQTAGEDVIRGEVQGAMATLSEGESKLGPKDMGEVMKVVQQRIMAEGCGRRGSW
ncbi:GatB/YqeY domain-containing protein [Acidisarcina polymorpha]|uniref:GatB/YqeY domain-containing protein n=1 Tax=Acidisarcina polymorpha TaxID=2211140 RepID=UPI001F2E4E53|nr:GatB/YqeY domain-containing protein [Acidisarcina polymorpha]